MAASSAAVATGFRISRSSALDGESMVMMVNKGGEYSKGEGKRDK